MEQWLPIGHRQDRELFKPASRKESHNLQPEKMLTVMTMVHAMGIAMLVHQLASEQSVPEQVEQACVLLQILPTAPTDLRRPRVSPPQRQRRYYMMFPRVLYSGQTHEQQQKAALIPPRTWNLDLQSLAQQLQSPRPTTAIKGLTHTQMDTHTHTMPKTKTKTLPNTTITMFLKTRSSQSASKPL